MLDISAIWLVNRIHKVSKYIAKFHPEERATHVVIQWKSVVGIIGFWFMM